MMNDETARLLWNRRLYGRLLLPVGRKKRDYERIVRRMFSANALLSYATFYPRPVSRYRSPPNTTDIDTQQYYPVGITSRTENLHVLFNLFCVSRGVSSIHCDNAIAL